MNDIIQIGGPEPVPVVVELLQHLLELAERGEIIGIAFGAAHHGRHTGSGYAAGEATIADLYLGIERCKLQMLRAGE